MGIFGKTFKDGFKLLHKFFFFFKPSGGLDKSEMEMGKGELSG